MRVARQRSAEAQPVGAGLLLDDTPVRMLPHGARITRIFRSSIAIALHALEVLHERGPEDASLHGDQPTLGVERQHTVERTGIDEDAGLPELLAAHRMPPARDRHGLSVAAGASNRRCELADVARRDDRGHARRVQLRVDIVDEDARDLVLDGGECW